MATYGFSCKNGHSTLIDTEINGLNCLTPGCTGTLDREHMVKGGHLYPYAWPGGEAYGIGRAA